MSQPLTNQQTASPEASAEASTESALHPSLAAPATAANRLLTELLGDSIISLSIVGHTVTEGLGRKEMAETAAVLEGDLIDHALKLGQKSSQFVKARLAAPLLMTPQYIQQSLDTFPIEYLYMQLLHHTVTGPDPFAPLRFDKPHVRIQAEREAKRYLLHLRQGLMHSRGKHNTIRRLMHELLNSMVPLLNAVLYLKDVDRLPNRKATIAAVDEALGLDMSPFMQVFTDVAGEAAIKKTELLPVLHRCYESLETLIEWLDDAA